MSHTSVFNKVKVSSLKLLQSACEQLGYSFRLVGEGKVRLWQGNVPGAVAAVKLPNWRYEVAVNSKGEILYDHFGSTPDSFKYLGLMTQRYNELATVDAYVGVAQSVYVEEKPQGYREVIVELE